MNPLISVFEPVKASVASLGAVLPKLGALFLILVAGCLLAIGITILIGWLLKTAQLEKWAKQVKIPEVLKKGGIGLSLSELVCEIVFFLVIVGTLITTLEFYGLATGALTSAILSYIPHVIAAMFILILGILVAILISGIITLVGGNVKIAQAQGLANMAKIAILVVAGLVALKELGLGIVWTEKSKDIVMTGIVLALALAFGLGSKERANKFLSGLLKE